MLSIILEGVVIGVTLSILIGPVFFQLIQATIENGVRAGLIYASGIWLSDFIFILLSILACSQISQFEKDFHYGLGIASSLVLIGFGISNFVLTPKIASTSDLKQTLQSGIYFVSGFVVNSINPATTLIWIALASRQQLIKVNNILLTIVFFSSIWLTILLFDLLKIAFAKKLKSTLNQKNLRLLNKIIGAILCFCGVLLIIKMFY
jgi:threonine/homoserine/homoserine lactone efflux protein